MMSDLRKSRSPDQMTHAAPDLNPWYQAFCFFDDGTTGGAPCHARVVNASVFLTWVLFLIGLAIAAGVVLAILASSSVIGTAAVNLFFFVAMIVLAPALLVALVAKAVQIGRR